MSIKGVLCYRKGTGAHTSPRRMQELFTRANSKFHYLTHRVHTEWQLPISGVRSIIMEKAAWLMRVGGARPPPLTLGTITYKVAVYTPYFISTHIRTLWFDPPPGPPPPPPKVLRHQTRSQDARVTQKQHIKDTSVLNTWAAGRASPWKPSRRRPYGGRSTPSPYSRIRRTCIAPQLPLKSKRKKLTFFQTKRN